MKRFLTTTFLLLFAAACAAPMATYYAADFSALYRRTQVHYAASDGPVPLVIRGNPFPGVDAQRLAAATITGMTLSAAIWPVRLTTGDPGRRTVDFRFVVAYGEPLLGANGLCAAPDAPFVPGDRIAATAAFCIGERLVSTARGRLLEPADSPEGPAFQSFLQGLTNAMLPPENPRIRSCGYMIPC